MGNSSTIPSPSGGARAGFRRTPSSHEAEVAQESLDDRAFGEIFRLRKTYENVQGWVAYVVGVK